MTTQATETTTWVTIMPHTCGECGVVFGMAERFVEERRRSGRTWYCPNGHPRVFRETTEQRLRRELEQARDLQRYYQQDAEAERRQRIALKGQLTRARRRAAHGVCPVPDCHRRPFDNLAAHMAAKHPEYVAEADCEARSGPAAAAGGQVHLDGPYGSMRKKLKQGGPGYRPAAYYACACGWEGGAARGAAAKHARTCPQACQPWPQGPAR